MSFVIPDVVVRRIVEFGISELRKNKPAFDDLFAQFDDPFLNQGFGPNYREQIFEWFTTTKLPVINGWAFNAQKIPCISVHLANATEDESKAAIGDIFGTGEDSEIGTAVLTTMVDIGIHTAQGGDHIIWLSHVVFYVLFKYKLLLERYGLKLQTYSASDYSKDADKAANNVWTRWVRFRCTTENYWAAEPLREFEHVNTEPTIQGPESCDVAASLDVNVCNVDRRANKGIIAEPSSDTEVEEYDTFIDIEDIDI